MAQHGGDIYRYNFDVIDYSSNINPLGVPISFIDALNKNINDFVKYPDVRYDSLKKVIANYLGNDINEKNVLLGNGAVELIHKVISAFSWNKVIVPAPGFAEYKSAVSKNNLNLLELPLQEVKEDNDYKFVYDKNLLIEKVEENDLVILCNPNNPTGSLIDVDTLLSIAEYLKKKKSFLMIDEAFIEFTQDYPNASFVNHIKELNNVCIIRAATKFFGMPGIRLGYAVTYNEDILDKINYLLEPWNINTAAVIAGEVIFNDKAYINNTRNWINSELSNMYEELRKINGLRVFKTNTNFVLVRILSSNYDSYTIKERLLKDGFLIRTPDGFSNLTRQYFRLAIKDKESNKKLINFLRKEVLK